MPKLIYAADDEENIRNLVKSFLVREGYEVEVFATGDALLAAFRGKPCDLVILDVMMPGSDGFEVCAQLRQVSPVPIVMLTARDSDADYVVGITLGSDDYFTKPFSPTALTMRVKAIFRRIEMEKQPSAPIRELRFADLVVHAQSKAAAQGGVPLELTPNEFALLAFLVEHQDRAVSREELLNRLWGYDTAVETRAADDTVKRLRKKLAQGRTVIDTVWGFGFRLKERGPV
jgi:DNA-binding response OmpR family regulator